MRYDYREQKAALGFISIPVFERRTIAMKLSKFLGGFCSGFLSGAAGLLAFAAPSGKF